MNCKFAKEQGTRLHQKLKTTDGWADGEHARTQLLHQFLASAEVGHGWSPVHTKLEWRKESENSTFQSKKHMVQSCGSSPSAHRVRHKGKCGWHEPNEQSTFPIAVQQSHRVEHVMRRQKFLHHTRGRCFNCLSTEYWHFLATLPGLYPRQRRKKCLLIFLNDYWRIPQAHRTIA